MDNDYAKRLIKGVRKSIKDHMEKEHKKLLQDYPESICAEWLDAELLCTILEDDFALTNNATKADTGQ